MDGLLIAVVGAIGAIGGAAIDRLITAWLGRRRTRAESGKIDSESESLMSITIKTFQDIYQDLIKDQMVRISRLEDEQAASGSRIIGLEKLVEEQRGVIASLMAEITQLKEQLVSLGHVPGEKKEG